MLAEKIIVLSNEGILNHSIYSAGNSLPQVLRKRIIEKIQANAERITAIKSPFRGRRFPKKKSIRNDRKGRKSTINPRTDSV
jgi:hypothetical protein